MECRPNTPPGIALAHLLQSFFGRNATVHDPDASGLAILRLDFLEKQFEGGSVAGVARHDFIGQRKTFGTEHHRDDHLSAIRTLVPAVAVFGLGSLLHLTLEISAGQVIEQQVVSRTEEIFPAPLQVAEEGSPMLVKPIQTLVKTVLGGHREVLLQQLIHRAGKKPAPV